MKNHMISKIVFAIFVFAIAAPQTTWGVNKPDNLIKSKECPDTDPVKKVDWMLNVQDKNYGDWIEYFKEEGDKLDQSIKQVQDDVNKKLKEDSILNLKMAAKLRIAAAFLREKDLMTQYIEKRNKEFAKNVMDQGYNQADQWRKILITDSDAEVLKNPSSI